VIVRYVNVSVPGNASPTKEEFTHLVLSVVEILMQHPAIISQYHVLVSAQLTYSLVQLCLSENGKFISPLPTILQGCQKHKTLPAISPQKGDELM